MCQACCSHVPRRVSAEAANQRHPGPSKFSGLCLYYNCSWIVSFCATKRVLCFASLKGELLTVAVEHKQNFVHK